MNKLLIATIATSLATPKSDISNAIHKFDTSQKWQQTEPEQVKITIEPSWEDLIDAIIYVESRGDNSAIGDGGKAVGCLQIHPVLVREVNRLLKKHKSSLRYSLQDRYDRDKSIQMFNIIAEQYRCCDNVSFMQFAETVARRWNGGPRGDKKKATIKYWKKVKPHLQNKYEEQSITDI